MLGDVIRRALGVTHGRMELDGSRIAGGRAAGRDDDDSLQRREDYVMLVVDGRTWGVEQRAT